MKGRKFLTLFLTFSVLCTSTALLGNKASAVSTKKTSNRPITIKVGGAYYAATADATIMSSQGGTGYRIGTLSRGTIVYRTDGRVSYDSDGYAWYLISYSGGTGWVCSECLVEINYGAK